MSLSKKTRIAFGRRFGASPEARARMAEADAAALWTVTCKHCKQVYKATIADIWDGKAHTCGPPREQST